MPNHKQYVTVERILLKRGATDIERKVAAFMTSGAATYIVLGILSGFGIKVSPQIAEALPLVIGGFGGWLTHSAGAATHTTITEPGGRTIESTTTGAVPIQAPTYQETYVPRGTPSTPVPQSVPTAVPAPVSTSPAEERVNPEVPEQAPADGNATVVLPNTPARAYAFLNSLPSQQDGEH